MRHEALSPAELVNNSLYFESKTFLHGLLIVEDKLSMAHGLETRVPMLDNDLVDFAMRVPQHMTLNQREAGPRIDENRPGSKPTQYFEETQDGKLIFRELAARLVPEDVSKAQKRGFSAPDASWFKGESIDFLTNTILDPRSPVHGILDGKMVSSLISEHISGSRNRRLLAWSLLNLHYFLLAFDVET